MAYSALSQLTLRRRTPIFSCYPIFFSAPLFGPALGPLYRSGFDLHMPMLLETSLYFKFVEPVLYGSAGDRPGSRCAVIRRAGESTRG